MGGSKGIFYVMEEFGQRPAGKKWQWSLEDCLQVSKTEKQDAKTVYSEYEWKDKKGKKYGCLWMTVWAVKVDIFAWSHPGLTFLNTIE